MKIIFRVRHILWRVLGFDYDMLLNKTNFTLLKDDKHSYIETGTYDNGAIVWRWTDSKLKIGKYCSIAHNVNFIMDEAFHTQSNVTNYPLNNRIKHLNENIKKIKQSEGITVGNDVWIGMGAYIMPGVKIGNGAVIAANAVVTKNVDDYEVVGGVPAKHIRTKHNQEKIKKLNEIAWWEWDKRLIEDKIAEFYLTIEEFIKKNEQK
ncbi:CatB-related O-acetyltransferase [Algibacter lectus]|nr:CatB-related O-acetyltransferase [Algibacter lectus]